MLYVVCVLMLASHRSCGLKLWTLHCLTVEQHIVYSDLCINYNPQFRLNVGVCVCISTVRVCISAVRIRITSHYQ